MIDVHVLTYSGTREEWLAQCLRSLEGQSCTVHVVQGDEGNVGSGRARGYAIGEHEYVSYVDSDDYVLPGVMDVCLEVLQHNHAVVTRERRLWGTHLDKSRMGGHHLTVYRRDQLASLLPILADHPIHCDQLVVNKIKPVQTEFLGYVWRMHGAQGHRRATLEQRLAMEAACPL